MDTHKSQTVLLYLPYNHFPSLQANPHFSFLFLNPKYPPLYPSVSAILTYYFHEKQIISKRITHHPSRKCPLHLPLYPARATSPVISVKAASLSFLFVSFSYQTYSRPPGSTFFVTFLYISHSYEHKICLNIVLKKNPFLPHLISVNISSLSATLLKRKFSK